MTDLVQVSPNFPPVVCGVGHYAALLASELESLSTPITTVVANENPISQWGQSLAGVRSPNALSDALFDTGARTVVVHFSPYGYAPRGLCQWLVAGLQQWKQSQLQGRIVTIFHEVFATGPIWRASFWTSISQRRIARDLARITDIGFVTSQAGYEQLEALCPRLSLKLLPVFSNMGEPSDTLPLFSREPLAVVFGGVGWRVRAYAAAIEKEEALTLAFDRLGITKIIDIGPAVNTPQMLAGRPVQVLGALPSEVVSAWMGRARMGLMDYPRHVLTKSGIAAAYFAHGMLVVNTSLFGRLPNDLVEGRDFVTPEWLSQADVEPQAIAAAGQDWYKAHGLNATVLQIMRSIA